MPRPPLHYEPEFARMASPFAPRAVAGPHPSAVEAAANATAQRIARRFGFCADFPLRTEVETAIGMFCALSRRQRPNREGKIRRIDLMQKEAARCVAGDDRHVALGRLLMTNPADLPRAPQRFEHCFVRDGETLVPVLDVEFTRPELDSVVAAAQDARRRMEKMRHHPGPGSGDLWILLAEVRQIWEDGTGLPACHVVDSSGRPTRPSIRFFAFIRWVMRATGRYRLKRNKDGARAGATSPAALARAYFRLDQAAPNNRGASRTKPGHPESP